MKKLILIALTALPLLLASCSSNNTELEERVDNLEKVTLASIQEQMTSIKSTLLALNDSQDSLRLLIRSVQDTLTLMQADADAKANVIESIQTALRALQDAQSDVEKEVAALWESIGGEGFDIKNWVEQSFATLTQVNALQEDLATVNATIQQMKTQLSGIESGMADLQTQISELKGRAENLTGQLSECQSALAEVQKGLRALQDDMDAVKQQMAAIVSAVQSVVVVPDQTDGSVRFLYKEALPIRFEVYPLETAKNVADLGASALSLDYVEAETKAESELKNIPVTAVTFNGEFLVVTMNTRQLPQKILSGEQGISLRLKISDGTVTRTSPYFGISLYTLGIHFPLPARPHYYNEKTEQFSYFTAEGKSWVRMIDLPAMSMYQLGPVPSDAKVGDSFNAALEHIFFLEPDKNTTTESAWTVMSHEDRVMTLRSSDHTYFVFRF